MKLILVPEPGRVVVWAVGSADGPANPMARSDALVLGEGSTTADAIAAASDALLIAMSDLTELGAQS